MKPSLSVYLILGLLAALIIGGIVARNKKMWVVPTDNPNYQKWAAIFDATEKNLGMPQHLLVRVAWQESRFRTDIISCQKDSPAGARGIMQIVPRWHPNAEPCNPALAIPYAGAYLHTLKQRFGDWEKALAAYNWGQGNLSKLDLNKSDWLDFTPGETRQYVTSVKRDLGGVLV
ncbi:MAG: lytic transglycosylase domain-containing protein [Methyloprofundus sp.]|nr:lytic transglycosylase domain-containing protein [Methyloprofundus sp.]